MNILAIDTSFERSVLSVQTDKQTRTCYQLVARQHAETILFHIDTLLKQAEITLPDIQIIGAGCGPASFTGIRLALSVAQALSYGIHCAVVGINSLALLAQSAYLQTGNPFVQVAVTARSGQCYWGEFSLQKQSTMQAIEDAGLCATDKLMSLANDTALQVGNGWDVTPLKSLALKDMEQLSEGLLSLIHHAIDAGDSLPPSRLRANYVLTDLYKKGRLKQ